MKLTLGFSPCPNDTFIFDAMVHGRIDTEGLEFDYFLADVEELNRRAFDGTVDITKMSFHAYAYAANNYLILDSGSALGRKSGPLLISKRHINSEELSDKLIAIPGKYTTANLLLGIAWPEAVNRKEYLFSDIEAALLNEEVDAGLIIHETRFTYAKKGLLKIADLGVFWEKMTNLPVPLGTIVVKRSLPYDVALRVNRIVRRSLEFAYRDSVPAFDFVVGNAKEMDKNVMNSHIKLFVNDFTLNLGDEGRSAIEKFFSIGSERKAIPALPDRIFLTPEQNQEG
jgi:1,4-dihydroxy-6-naphthoate synthase